MIPHGGLSSRSGSHLLIHMESDQLDDADYVLMAIRGLSDMLCELPDMHVVQPDNLNALLSIVADRLEAALERKAVAA